MEVAHCAILELKVGAGGRQQDVNQLLKQFREMKKMMKTMTRLAGKGRQGAAQQMLGGRLGG